MGRASDYSTRPVAVCHACHHPRPVPDGGGTVWAVTNLRAMEIGADEAGCVTCGLLSRSFRSVVGPIPMRRPETIRDGDNRDDLDTGADGGKVNDVRWLRIDFNSAATTPSLELFDFTTSTRVTAFCSTSKSIRSCQITQPTAVLVVGARKRRQP
jgi:hypothetical protein